MPPWEKYQQQSTGKPWEKYSQSAQQQINPELEGAKAALGAVTKPIVPESNQFLQALSRNPALPMGYFSTPQMGKVPSFTFPVPGFMSQPGANARVFSGETSPLALAGTALGAMGLKNAGPTAQDIESGVQQFRNAPKQVDTPGVISKYFGIRSQLKDIQKQYGANSVETLNAKLDETASNATSELEQFKQDYPKQLKEISGQEAIQVKPKIKEFGENLTKSYGKAVDELDTILEKQDIPVTINQGEIGTDLMTNAMNKVSGDVKSASKLQNYLESKGYVVNSQVNEFGDNTYRVYPLGEFSQPVTMKNLLGIKNEISNIGGNAYHSFRDAWGEYIANGEKFPFQISEKFKDMQSAYAPLANAKWEAYKIFRPFEAGDVNITRASKFYRDIAEGSLDAGKQNILNMVEKGSEFSPGVGDISSRIKQLGVSGITKESDLTRTINDTLTQQKYVETLAKQKKEIEKAGLTLLGLFGLGAEAIRGGRDIKAITSVLK